MILSPVQVPLALGLANHNLVRLGARLCGPADGDAAVDPAERAANLEENRGAVGVEDGGGEGAVGLEELAADRVANV